MPGRISLTQVWIFSFYFERMLVWSYNAMMNLLREGITTFSGGGRARGTQAAPQHKRFYFSSACFPVPTHWLSKCGYGLPPGSDGSLTDGLNFLSSNFFPIINILIINVSIISPQHWPADPHWPEMDSWPIPHCIPHTQASGYCIVLNI